MWEDKLGMLKVYRDDLTKVRIQIVEQKKLIVKDPNSFAYQLSLQSLEHREEEVEQNIKAIEEQLGIISLDLKLDSPDMASGSIPLEMFGNAMIGLQRLINSIGQAMSSGPIDRGPFSFDVLKSTQLQLSGIYPGSFGMYLNGRGEENLLGDNLLKSSLDKLKEVLEIENEIEFVNQLEELGLRTINAYKDWLGKLEASEVTLEIKFNKSISNKPIIKTPGNMNRIRQSLENIAEVELEEVSLNGVFVGGNIRSGNFEFSSGDQIISGKATNEVKEKFKNFHLGEELKAILDKKTFEGISKTVWTMKDVEKII